jgi:serine/threonine-protein kinase
VAQLRAHASEAPPDPRRYAPSLSRELAEALLRALAKRPADRFESAAAMRAAIEATPEARGS